MSFNKKIRELLELHEGKRTKPYTDTEGNLTIGIGYNLENGIPDEIIYRLLEIKVEEAKSELDRDMPDWKDHSQDRQLVLVDMMYNLGAPKFHTFFKMRKALLTKDYETAADEMLDSKWARQVGMRAERLADMMRAG